MNALLRGAAGGTGVVLAREPHLEVDVPLGGAEFDFLHFPRRLQAQGGGEPETS